jgi:hypothetical protein
LHKNTPENLGTNTFNIILEAIEMTKTFEIYKGQISEGIHYYQLRYGNKIYEVTSFLSNALGVLYKEGFRKVEVSTENFSEALKLVEIKAIYGYLHEYEGSLLNGETYFVRICREKLQEIWGRVPPVLYWKALK